MTTSLKVHAKRLRQRQHSRSRDGLRSASRMRADVNGVLSGDRSTTRPPGAMGVSSNTSVIDSKLSANEIDRPNGSVDDRVEDHDTSLPRQDVISSDTLEVKTKTAPYDRHGRRSLRQQLVHQREDFDLDLYINLRSIRKKLNWKSNKPSDQTRQPPRKRVRLDELACHAHLTIWASNPASRDNSWHLRVNETEECTMIRGSSDVDHVKGRYIQLSMNSPFRVPKKKLRLPVHRGRESVLEMAQKYFMEIKIVPVQTDTDWPPIPTLTRHSIEATDLELQAKSMLQNSLVASYQKLPEPPDAETPLSICFLSEFTLETKYGLELDAKWTAPDPNHKPKVEAPIDVSLEPWMNDDGGKPFGRLSAIRKKSTTFRAHRTAPTGKLVKSNPVLPREPKVTYRFDPARSREQRGFRDLSVSGFSCQICSGKSWQTIEELLLHLENIHHRYTFSLETQDAEQTGLREYTIKIEKTIHKPVSKAREKIKKEEEEFNWQVPHEPFDIKRHTIDEDKSWIGAELSKTKARKPAQKAFVVTTGADPQTILRRQNNGHLPYQHVAAFRPKEHQRKRHVAIRLKTLTNVVDSTPYTSISHRAVIPEEADEARSETDDEIDDSWFVAHYLEELELYARDKQWTLSRHELAKKWDYHILKRERAVNSRYLSDCLIRFARIERKWILDNDDKLQTRLAVARLMRELEEKRVITIDVVSDVWTIINHSRDSAEPCEEEKAELTSEKEHQQKVVEHTRLQKAEIMQTVKAARLGVSTNQSLANKIPASMCVKCGKNIYKPELAVRCSNLECGQSGLWYHADCAGLKLPKNEEKINTFTKQGASLHAAWRKERASWRCSYCTNREGQEQGDHHVGM